MKDQICLKDAPNGNVSFVFENERALQDDFFHIKPQWMSEENQHKNKLPARRIDLVTSIS